MNDNWIDILPPISPAETLPLWLWFALVLFILLVPAFYYWYQSAQQKSLRTLKALHRQLNNNIDIQSIPFTIRKTIQQRFKVNNIEQIIVQDMSSWQDYKQQLQTYCFSQQKPDVAEINSLLFETARWLRQESAL